MDKVTLSHQTLQQVKLSKDVKMLLYIYKLKEQPAQPKGNVYVHYVDKKW